MHPIAILLKKAHDSRQVAVVAAFAKAEKKRQCSYGAEIDPDVLNVRPRDTTDDHEILASVLVQGRENLPDLAPFDPGVRKPFDIRVRLALDRHDVDGDIAGGGCVRDERR
jgi:hypothetical protein